MGGKSSHRCQCGKEFVYLKRFNDHTAKCNFNGTVVMATDNADKTDVAAEDKTVEEDEEEVVDNYNGEEEEVDSYTGGEEEENEENVPFFPRNFAVDYTPVNFEVGDLQYRDFVVFKDNVTAEINDRRPGEAGKFCGIIGRKIRVLFEDGDVKEVAPKSFYLCKLKSDVDYEDDKEEEEDSVDEEEDDESGDEDDDDESDDEDEEKKDESDTVNVEPDSIGMEVPLEDFFPNNFYQYDAQNFEFLVVGDFVIFKESNAAFVNGRNPGDAGKVIEVNRRWILVKYEDGEEKKISPRQVYKCVF